MWFRTLETTKCPGAIDVPSGYRDIGQERPKRKDAMIWRRPPASAAASQPASTAANVAAPPSANSQKSPSQEIPALPRPVPFAVATCTLVEAPTDEEQAGFDACVRANSTLSEFWRHATQADWMLDLLRGQWHRIAIAPEKPLRTFALRCVEKRTDESDQRS